MADPYYSERRIGDSTGSPRRGLLYIAALLLLVLLASRYLASTLIDYKWWTEMGQTDTWLDLYLYGTGPLAIAFLLFVGAFWTAFKLGIRSADNGPMFGFLSVSLLSKIALLVILVLAFLLANITVNSWAIVRYFGGLRLPPSAGEFVDPIFHHSLPFYFFQLPFYETLLRVVLVGAVDGDPDGAGLRFVDPDVGGRGRLGGGLHGPYARFMHSVLRIRVRYLEQTSSTWPSYLHMKKICSAS